MKSAAILGCTRGMGRALALELAGRGYGLFLWGRDETALADTKRDIEARHPGTIVGSAICDLATPDSLSPAVDAAFANARKPSVVIVTAAQFATQEQLEADTEKARQLATINFANTLAFCEYARKAMDNRGTLCVFSSVAGDRGRKPVIIYGASKAGLSHYLEGLDHKYRDAGLNVLTVKPGFVKTEMTAGLQPPPFAGKPETVAEDVADAIERGAAIVYTPAPWRAVMTVIKALPRQVMRKINF